MTRHLAAIAVLCVCLSHPGYAADWYVSPTGSDSNSGTNAAQAFLTISNAIGHAADSDNICLTAGTHSFGFETIVNKGVTIIGLGGAAATTVRRSGTGGEHRVFRVIHPNAVLRDLTAENGRLNGQGAGVYMNGGLLCDCTVQGNYGYGNGFGAAEGGGLLLTGTAIASNCVIRGNQLNVGTYGDTSRGAGVFLDSTGCQLVDSTVTNNHAWSDYRPRGGGIHIAAGTVDRCLIARNRCTGTAQSDDETDGGHGGGGGGIYMTGGTARNSLIAANSYEAGGLRHGGGVKVIGGTIENCTIVRNYCVALYGGAYVNGGSLVNSIVTDNSGTVSSNINTTAGVTNSCGPELTAGTGNLYDDPTFVDPGAGYGLTAALGDYHLQLHSSCVDAGTAASSSLDLDRNTRPRDGDTDGTPAWDMGCYEVSPTAGTFRCAFRTPTPNGVAPLTPVFRAYVAGPNTNVTTYLWDFENDGTNDATGPDKQVVSNTYASIGSYTVRLTVSNSALDSATLARTNYIVVGLTAYVSPWGSHTPPFTNWLTAATNIQAAVDSVLPGGLVLVTNGTYGITSPVSITKATTLRSVNGAESTILDAGWRCRGLSLAQNEAVVDGFTITHGYAANGAGVYLTGGRLQNGIVRNNKDDGTGSGAGVWMSLGTLRNCVVAGNRAGAGTYGAGRGGGICMSGGAVENCTVSRNATSLSEGGIYRIAGSVLNTVVYDNKAPAATNVNTAAGFTNCCARELTTGIGNITSDPRFMDVGIGYGFDLTNGNFRLGLGSPCADAGTNLAAVANDLAGAPRPLDGDGDDVARHDIGAYEVATPPTGGVLRCYFSTPTNSGFAPFNPVFTASVAGTNTNSITYFWDFTSDGTTDDSGPTRDVATGSYPSPSWYTVTLTVSNALGETAVFARTNYIQMPLDAAYVSLAGSHTPPYTNWATAATDIGSALDEIGGTNNPVVYVTNGTYNVTIQLVVNRALTVQGVGGASNVIVRRSSGTTRIFSLTHPGAVLDSLTISNGYLNSTGNGAGVNMSGGIVRNCMILGNRTDGFGAYAGGIYMSGGLLQGCAVANNLLYGHQSRGGGVVANGSTVSNCLIVGNAINPAAGYDTAYGAGVFLTGGGKLLNSTVTSNSASSNHRPSGAGLYIEDGASSVDGCVITFNQCNPVGVSDQVTQGGAGVNMQGGFLRNCLVAANSYTATHPWRLGGGVRMDGGIMENCTVVRNYNVNSNGGVYRAGSAAITNCIIIFNNGLTVSNIAVHASIAYSCAPELTAGLGNLFYDPEFMNSGAGYGTGASLGDYHLQLHSPCVDTGTASLSSNDLDRVPRPQDSDSDGIPVNDMGAYEVTPTTGVFRCAFRTPSPAGLAPFTVVFRAYVAGLNTNVVAYAWDFDNDGTNEIAGPDRRVVTNTYVNGGVYTVRLAVTNDALETAALTRTNYIVAAPPVYVSLSGSGTPPYTNWAMAATTLQDAIDYVTPGGLVLVAGGTYAVTSPVSIVKEVTVRSVAGPESTTLDAGGSCRVLYMAQNDAVLDGFTLTRGYAINGAGVYMAGGRVQNGIVRNNKDDGTGSGAGVWMSLGTLRNCVVAGNRAGAGTYGVGRGGGVNLSGGAIQNCTISRNAAGLSEGGVYKTGGVILNTVIHDNLAPSASNINTSSGVTNSCAPELTGGGNITADPRFQDVGRGYGASLVGGNFRLGLGSPCLDTGTNLVEVTADLDSAPRPADGDGDGMARPDIGAYETQAPPAAGALRCYFDTPTNSGFVPFNPVFTAAVGGTNTNSITYFWDLDGNGTTDASSGSGTAGGAYVSPDWYTVTLTVSNAAGQTATFTRTQYIQIPFDVAFVSAAGSHTPPYATWATAANDIYSAVEQIGGTNNPTVYVTNGVYWITAPVVVNKGVTIRGVPGWTNTILARLSGDTRVLTLSHGAAVFDGLTVSNGYISSGYGAGINMAGGMVRNCNIVQNLNGYGQGGGIYMNGGMLLSSVVRGNQCLGNDNGGLYGRGAGVAAAGGAVVSNCTVINNTEGNLSYNDNSYGAGVYLSGASRLLFSRIVGNTAMSHHRLSGAGVYISDSGSSAENCMIVSNTCTPVAVSDQVLQGGAGVNMQGGLLRNCLVAGNSYVAAHPWRLGGGVRMDGGIMENCTVARNYNVNTNGGVYRTGSAAITNCIMIFNSGSGAPNVVAHTNIAYSCAPELTNGNGNLTVDPAFLSPGQGYGTTSSNADFRLKTSSPCANTGWNAPWMAMALDLDNTPRVKAGFVDMGAYETRPAGTLFFVH